VTTSEPSGVGRPGVGRRVVVIAVAALAALATVGGLACASGSGEVAQTGAGTVVTVDAVDNTFRPETIEVEPGTEVVWTNRGRSNHDVVPTEGGSWGIALSEFTPGESYSHVFTEPGEYPYYCTVHGTKTRGMVGTVVVKG
jgi:plastocyanin